MNKISLLNAESERKLYENQIECLKNTIEYSQKRLEEFKPILYKTSIKELHIKEIYRLAELQFVRLRGDFTDTDIAEVEKWIRRCKNDTGLLNIIEAFKEMNKYNKGDIIKNLYALIQKIIIEGPYKGKTR